MSDSTRRGFLGMAGASALAGAAVVVAGPGSASAAEPEDDRLPAGAAGAMAAYIHDLNKGELALMVEGREVIVTDKRLTARLARAFARAERS